MADPLPLFAFFPHDLRVKIPFHGKSADLNQLDHHRQARNCTLILNVGKIPPFNPNHFRQCFSCQTLCLSCSFDICAEGFKTRTILDYMTLKEAGQKWNVTPRQVNYLCSGGRIPGAVKMAGVWLIPKNAEKPIDGRTKQGKELHHE